MEKQQRLIDKDALKRWIETNKANANPLDYNTKATYAECITMVEAMETIDAVPVVRCKDCKYWESKNIVGTPYGTCTLLMVGMKMKDYCSYGERRCDNE